MVSIVSAVTIPPALCQWHSNSQTVLSFIILPPLFLLRWDTSLTVNGSDAGMKLVVFGGEVMPECCRNSFDNDTWVRR